MLGDVVTKGGSEKIQAIVHQEELSVSGDIVPFRRRRVRIVEQIQRTHFVLHAPGYVKPTCSATSCWKKQNGAEMYRH